MNQPVRPSLAAADDLTRPSEVDISKALAPLIAQRGQGPIVRPSTAAEVIALIDESFPEGGDSVDDLVAQFTRATARYPRRNTHPGHFGWVSSSGLPTDPLAHAMVAALNENIGGYWASPVGTSLEKTVIRWLAQLAGFPQYAEGVMLSGGSMANLAGMGAALASRFGPEYRQKGLAAYCEPEHPVIICSAEAHFSIRRAAVLLGFGSDHIVVIDTDAQMRMRVDALAEALQHHRQVVCVVASAGTTNTGAIDPLTDIADLCTEHGAWLHVDAAYGGGGLMSAELRPRYAGIERADSITMDLHKWFYQSLDGSLLLYRDAQAARDLFLDSSEYLQAPSDRSPEQFAFFHIAPELSRRFRALPFYLAMRHYGIERLGRNVLHNVQCARYLADRVAQEDDLELVIGPQLAILCFRFRPAGLDDDAIDRLNTAIRDQIQAEGDFLISPTRVFGRPVLRTCIINHATRAEHIDGLLDSILRIGRALLE